MFFLLKHGFPTLHAVCAILGQFQLPMDHTLAIMPQQGCLCISNSHILATCPSLQPAFPMRISGAHMHEMITESRAMLLSLMRCANVATTSCSLTGLPRREAQLRKHIYEVYDTTATLLFILERLGRVAVVCGGLGHNMVICQLALLQDMPRTQITPDVLEHQRRITRNRHVRLVEEQFISNKAGIATLGTIAGLQKGAIYNIVRQSMLATGAFLQCAAKSGFDVDHICVASVMLRQPTIEFLNVYIHEWDGVIEAQAALLSFASNMLQARHALRHREFALERLLLSMSLWEQAYLTHVLLWVSFVFDLLECRTTNSLAWGSPQIYGAQRRRFTTFVLESLSAVIWEFE